MHRIDPQQGRTPSSCATLQLRDDFSHGCAELAEGLNVETLVDFVVTEATLHDIRLVKVALAEEELLRKEQVRERELERRNQASIQEQITIARSAKNAAWMAAFGAMIAALGAVVAISYQLAPL